MMEKEEMLLNEENNTESSNNSQLEDASTSDENNPTVMENNDNNQNNEEKEEESGYKEMSPMRLIVRRFFRSKLSIVGLVMVIFLFLFAFAGPLVLRATGYGDTWADWSDGTIEIDKDTTPKTYYSTEKYTYVNEYGEEITIEQIVEIELGYNEYAPSSGQHFLGTDDKGMDVFVRLMYGGRISLLIGFIVVILETLLGVLLGGLAGYFGGWVDSLIMRIVDIFNCIPTLPILLIASAILDSWTWVPASSRIYYLMVIITIFGWSGTARIVRGQILSLREQEYITATEVMGLPTWRKIFLHLIPNVMPQLIVSMTLGLGNVILYESTLSYLGLGVQIPYAAWGTMISSVNDYIVLQNYPLLWLPAGFLIVIAVLGFNFVGDGLRDAMDPRSRK